MVSDRPSTTRRTVRATHRSLLVLVFHDGYDRAEFEQVVDHVAREDRLEVITGTDEGERRETRRQLSREGRNR